MKACELKARKGKCAIFDCENCTFQRLGMDPNSAITSYAPTILSCEELTKDDWVKLLGNEFIPLINAVKIVSETGNGDFGDLYDNSLSYDGEYFINPFPILDALNIKYGTIYSSGDGSHCEYYADVDPYELTPDQIEALEENMMEEQSRQLSICIITEGNWIPT